MLLLFGMQCFTHWQWSCSLRMLSGITYILKVLLLIDKCFCLFKSWSLTVFAHWQYCCSLTGFFLITASACCCSLTSLFLQMVQLIIDFLARWPCTLLFVIQNYAHWQCCCSVTELLLFTAHWHGDFACLQCACSLTMSVLINDGAASAVAHWLCCCLQRMLLFTDCAICSLTTLLLTDLLCSESEVGWLW